MDSADVKEFFERVSGDWDQMHQDFYSTDVIDALAEHPALGPDTHVVDVGTGTGFIAGGLAAHAGRVTCTDSGSGRDARRDGAGGAIGGTVAVTHCANTNTSGCAPSRPTCGSGSAPRP